MHKKAYFLMTLSLNGLLQPSQLQKALTPSNSDSTQSLTPFSPNSLIGGSTSQTTFPSVQSLDQFIRENNLNFEFKLRQERRERQEAEQKKEAEEKLEAAIFRHQKLFERLEKSKIHFFANQGIEKANKTFSDSEKLNNNSKVLAFEAEQRRNAEEKDATQRFLKAIEEQLIESQIYESVCLKELQEQSPKMSRQQLQELAEAMQIRHSFERESISVDTRTNLLNFWARK